MARPYHIGTVDGGKGVFDHRARIGLVLGGGGAKGAYQVGVLKALGELGVTRFECIAGTSVGTLNALLFATESVATAEEIWRGLGRILKRGKYAAFAAGFYGLTYGAMFLPAILTGILGVAYLTFAVSHVLFPPGLLEPERIRFALQALILSAIGITAIGFFSRTWEFSGAATFYTFDPTRVQYTGYAAVFLLTCLYVLTFENPTRMAFVWAGAAYALWAIWAMVVLILSRIARRYAFFENSEIVALIEPRLAYPENRWRCKSVFATIARETSYFDPMMREDGDSRFFKQRNGLTAEIGNFRTGWVPLYIDLLKEKAELQTSVLLASAAIPIGFPTIEDRSASRPNESQRIPLMFSKRWLCDGGVVDNVPVTAAANLAACDAIIVVSLNDGELPSHDGLQVHCDRLWARSVIPFLGIDERQALLDAFKATGDWPASVPGRRVLGGQRVITIAPSRPLCTFDVPVLRFFTGTLNFSPKMIDEWIALGYRDAMSQLHSLSGTQPQ